MISKQRRTSLDDATRMPPLRHTVGDQFDVQTSEVINWLVRQPRIRQYLFRTTAAAGLIVYDKATGMWRGKDYQATPPQKWSFS